MGNGNRVLTEKWKFADYLDSYTSTSSALPLTRNLTSTFTLASAGASFAKLDTCDASPTTSHSCVACVELCSECRH